MKHLFFLIGLLLIFPVFQSGQETNFDWISGEWIRTNGKAGLITTESWEKISDDTYKGIGLTKKNGETVFREDLRLIKKEENWVYEVVGVNVDTTNFIVTSYSGNSFSAENQENPFPKQIEYSYNEEKLTAEISDENRKIVFEFRRE